MTPNTKECSNNTKLFYKNQMTSNYKQEEQRLRKIIKEHVKSANDTTNIQLFIYYTNKKLSQLFLKNNQHKKEFFNVVYMYTCDNDRCQPDQSYIGYTTSTLRQRMTFHAQNGSIKEHNNVQHNKKSVTKDLLNNTKILGAFPNKQELIIAEALMIKQHKPTINSQQEFSSTTLHIF